MFLPVLYYIAILGDVVVAVLFYCAIGALAMFLLTRP